jgi:hypothetical protein
VTAADRARVLATLRDGLAEEVPAALAEQQQREDERAVAEIVERHGTHRDVARLVMPDLTDEQANHVLWEQTPFPLVQGVALLPYLRRAAEEADR